MSAAATLELLKMAELYQGKQSAERSFRAFVEQAWHILEPVTPFVPGIHVDAICQHLQAVSEGRIKDLIINIPPGHAKSLLSSVFWPAWVWGPFHHPETRWVTSSYRADLATRDSVKCRMLMASRWFQERWPIQFNARQDSKERYENSALGVRVITSVGTGLGERGDYLVCDDPTSREQAESDKERRFANDWWNSTMWPRVNDLATGHHIVIQQRLHQDDLTGNLLEKGGYTHLVLPQEFEPERACQTLIGWRDPRTKPGELLWPAKNGPAEVAELKKSLGSYGYCTPGHTPILMADWSEKRIEDVAVGDKIVAYGRGTLTQKAFLKEATVTALSRSVQMVYRYRMASGRVVECTADHRWYRRKRPASKYGPRAMYAPARIGSRLHSVYKPVPIISAHQQRLYDWLGGLIDGEGSCVGRNPIVITQSALNPDIQREITRVLDELGFRHGEWHGGRDKASRRGAPRNPKWSESGIYHINGGRSAKVHILAHCRMVKRQRIIDSLWTSARLLSDIAGEPDPKAWNHKVISVEPLGEMVVYGLTTTTGNYVAWGFASENSGQYQQRPSPATGGVFKRWWFRYWKPKYMDLKPVQIRLLDGQVRSIPAIDLPDEFDGMCDSWDTAFRILNTADYVAGGVWGSKGPKRFLMEQRHGRMEFPDICEAIQTNRKRWPKINATYVEDAANGSAIISTLRAKLSSIIAVKPEGGKVARAHAVSAQVEAGDVYLPHPAIAPWVDAFIEEAAAFPNATHDDQVDQMTQALLKMRDRRAMPQQGTPIAQPPSGDRSWMA